MPHTNHLPAQKLERIRRQADPLFDQAFEPTPLAQILDGLGAQVDEEKRRQEALRRNQALALIERLGPEALSSNHTPLEVILGGQEAQDAFDRARRDAHAAPPPPVRPAAPAAASSVTHGPLNPPAARPGATVATDPATGAPVTFDENTVTSTRALARLTDNPGQPTLIDDRLVRMRDDGTLEIIPDHGGQSAPLPQARPAPPQQTRPAPSETPEARSAVSGSQTQPQSGQQAQGWANPFVQGLSGFNEELAFAFGLPVTVVNEALRLMGIPVSDEPFLGTAQLDRLGREFGFIEPETDDPLGRAARAAGRLSTIFVPGGGLGPRLGSAARNTLGRAARRRSGAQRQRAQSARRIPQTSTAAEFQTAIRNVLETAKTSRGEVFRADLGPITIRLGDGKSGLRGIIRKRRLKDVPPIDGIHLAREILPEVLANGKLIAFETREGRRALIRFKNAEAVLRLDRDGKKETWLLTAYKVFDSRLTGNVKRPFEFKFIND